MMVSIKRPAAILFDLDGTLVDSALDFFDVVNSLRLEQGLPKLPDDQIRQQVSNGGIALAALTYGIERDHPDIWSYRQQVLDRYEQMIGEHSGLFPGFELVLARLDSLGVAWSIVTNKPRLYTDLLLDRLQLHAPSVVCPEDVESPKPAPDALLLAAKQLQVEPTDCWYVGDHRRDMEAARAAKMVAIGATFGYIEESDSPAAWPIDDLIDTPADLLTMLESAEQ